MKKVATKIGLAVSFASALAVGSFASQDAQAFGYGWCFDGQALPEGFNKYIVYMADAELTFEEANAPGDFDFWETEIMGRDEAESAEYYQKAVDFFYDKYGVDVETSTDVMFNPFYVPQIDYRAYTMSGRDIPSEGWFVQDGGYMMTITNPNGLALGGEFAGVVATPGAFMVYGDYAIEGTKKKKPWKDKTFFIHYESDDVIFPLADGSLHFRCVLEHPKWGEGRAQGISAPRPDLNTGMIKMNVRNVLSFSDDGGL